MAATIKFALYRNPSLLDFLKVCHKLPDDERDQIEVFTGQPYNAELTASQYFLRAGPRWMLCGDEEPMAIAGFDMIRPGVWQDWMFSTPEAWDPYWRTTTKHVRRVMDSMMKADAHRLQCVSVASRIHAHRWYAVLGLAPEAPLKAYGANGEDCIMFARVRDSDGCGEFSRQSTTAS